MPCRSPKSHDIIYYLSLVFRDRAILYTGGGEQSSKAREYLIRNNIEFKEIDTTKEENRHIATAKNRLPLLEVRKSYGIRTVQGFGEFEYASAFDSTLSYVEFMKRKAEKQKKLL